VTTNDEHVERFTHLRPLLFTIVYEILGSATESDDVLQDSYLRWAQVDLATVRDTKSYLAQLVTRRALKAIRTTARRREDYIGPWLPEPLLLDDRDASADVVLAESVSMAMLVLLETLTPDERAVFVLREVFGFDYDEIAGAVGKSAAAVRQVAHRAREHVHARRRRFEPVDPEQSTRITEQFLTAAATGDMDGLMALLSPDVTSIADGGGRVGAARRPVVGAAKVAAAIIKGVRRGLPDMRFEIVRGQHRTGRPGVLRRSLGGDLHCRDQRRQDHPLLRHCQSGQAGRVRSPADDQPLAFCQARSVRIERLGDLGRRTAFDVGGGGVAFPCADAGLQHRVG
jgi:RNA polymerase sigma-70 factor (ECF subfamily)